MNRQAALRALAKSERAARSITDGPGMFALIVQNGSLLVRAAKKNDQVPPIAVLGPLLHASYPDSLHDTYIKQWLGGLAKAILALSHYEIHRSGVRIVDNPVFATGSTYRFVGRGSESPENLATERKLRTFVRTLTDDERRILSRVIEEETA